MASDCYTCIVFSEVEMIVVLNLQVSHPLLFFLSDNLFFTSPPFSPSLPLVLVLSALSSSLPLLSPPSCYLPPCHSLTLSLFLLSTLSHSLPTLRLILLMPSHSLPTLSFFSHPHIRSQLSHFLLTLSFSFQSHFLYTLSFFNSLIFYQPSLFSLPSSLPTFSFCPHSLILFLPSTSVTLYFFPIFSFSAHPFLLFPLSISPHPLVFTPASPSSPALLFSPKPFLLSPLSPYPP